MNSIFAMDFQVVDNGLWKIDDQPPSYEQACGLNSMQFGVLNCPQGQEDTENWNSKSKGKKEAILMKILKTFGFIFSIVAILLLLFAVKLIICQNKC